MTIHNTIAGVKLHRKILTKRLWLLMVCTHTPYSPTIVASWSGTGELPSALVLQEIHFSTMTLHLVTLLVPIAQTQTGAT